MKFFINRQTRATTPVAIALYAILATSLASAADFRLELKETSWELKPGLSTSAWTFGGTVPGTPIVVRQGETVRIEVVNHLPEATNVHWHGLILPVEQDGPSLSIQPGATHNYEITANESGTYWYHPHFMPVLPQLDRGLYGAFVVLAPEDARYSGDHTFVLDDWLLDDQGRRIEGTAPGDMERHGNVETVNGKTGTAIAPLRLLKGELHKLRFINASTASVHNLSIQGHRFRITHTDGQALAQPFLTDSIKLAPGERIDAELAATGDPGRSYEITSARRASGMVIPVVYDSGSVPVVNSPFVVPKPRGYTIDPNERPDIILQLGSAMPRGTGGHGMMGHGNTGNTGNSSNTPTMIWTINGRAHPDTIPIEVSLNKVVTMRVYDRDMMGMMMGHGMEHSVHLHGTTFQVLSVNGRAPAGEVWKDTVPVPTHGYVDLAFVMTNPGDWMLHCHIIDHEDGGMMTVVRAR
jgi:FtsP/CotA-like multicopper oxidase with cupredoxin domain